METARDRRAKKELGDALTELWRENGEPPTTTIHAWLIEDIGARRCPTVNTIRNLHQGNSNPWKASPEVLYGLARFYGVPLSELGPETVERIDALRDLLNSDVMAGSSQNWKRMSLGRAA